MIIVIKLNMDEYDDNNYSFELKCLYILGPVLNAFCPFFSLFEPLQCLIWWIILKYLFIECLYTSHSQRLGI